MSGAASAAVYNFNGLDLEVDYWAGSGANETIIVVDWNNVNGPYTTPTHAFGYRWNGSETVADALTALELAGGLDLDYGFGGGFVSNAHYNDGVDAHTANGNEGWFWLGGSTDLGQTWQVNGGGVNAEPLVDGGIEGINTVWQTWTGPPTLPLIPEPASLALLGLGAVALGRRR